MQLILLMMAAMPWSLIKASQLGQFFGFLLVTVSGFRSRPFLIAFLFNCICIGFLWNKRVDNLIIMSCFQLYWYTVFWNILSYKYYHHIIFLGAQITLIITFHQQWGRSFCVASSHYEIHSESFGRIYDNKQNIKKKSKT